MKIAFTLFCIIVLSFCFAIAEEAAESPRSAVDIAVSSPDGRSWVHGKIHLGSNTKDRLYVYNSYLNRDIKLLERSFRYHPNVKWHSNDQLEVEIGTGSPGRYSVFYDLRNDKMSPAIWFVIAYDFKRRLAVVGVEKVLITKVFRVNEPHPYDSSNSIEIKRDFALTAITWLIIKNGKFDAQGNFVFEYQNTEGKWVKSVVYDDDIDF